MAEIINVEENVSVRMNFHKIEEMRTSNFETWLSCSLEIKSKTINCMIGQDRSFSLNLYEVNNLIKKIKNILDSFSSKKDYSFEFTNYECNFEIRMDNVIVDDVIEVEIWINWGNYTNGEEGGYDLGIRFVVQKEMLQVFGDSLNEEILCVLKR